ncbi:helix-turn-helix domain-containing protein [Salmonella enterica]|uniref:Helix-turn-helix domain-containing protein n=1 Tax=Salmonella muenchen TaxID=596 RepID=A0A628R0Z6_SALMU|nr:helix-turn-helix domain-containing protein [Salmonella enterica]EDX6463204.1 helix-turn-helix domain-containing protein [Salmonella enterica subsp. diarizonae serovar 60:r:e,n,x,z15]EAB4923735.1 helix-turn-helix domain-containing protein [Salmonella enterica]EAB4972437.1 helix-turn-helix domain-containing protein [Salmonella enterica]EAN6513759.1 helix-turn-helix domain-containing protein [Salmonella enterica]EAO2916656.1 helix-turn-helix domain-containing protein [Salmonella enterica]
MSMMLMVKAMQIKVGNPLRKLVLLKLADNASDQGECWPSYQYIADQCEISKRSVMNHIDELCKSGLLKKVFRKGPKGNATNVYILTIPGAGDSPGVVQEIHQGSAGDSLPGAGDSPGGSAGAAPRISHSFEPVNEPLNTQAAKAACAIGVNDHHIAGRYAFEGNVIRLNHKDYRSWMNLYPLIDLNYELQRLDIEFTHEKPKNWFITASQKLSYQNKQAAARTIPVTKPKLDLNNTDWIYGVEL